MLKKPLTVVSFIQTLHKLQSFSSRKYSMSPDMRDMLSPNGLRSRKRVLGPFFFAAQIFACFRTSSDYTTDGWVLFSSTGKFRRRLSLCQKGFFFFFGQVEHQTIAGLNPILDSDVLRTFLFYKPSALVSWTGKTKETHFTAG